MSITGVRFCDDCSNLLSPVEDVINKRLQYKCKNCDFIEAVKDPETENCIYMNVLTLSTNIIRPDKEWALDPTLSRAKDVNCPKCHHNVAVFFQKTAKTGKGVSMKLRFVCCGRDSSGDLCGQSWDQEVEKKDE